MVLIILSIFLSALVVNVQKAGENGKQVPAWLRLVTIESLGRIFCLTRNKGHIKKTPSESNQTHEKEKGHHGGYKFSYEYKDPSSEAIQDSSNQAADKGSVIRKLDEIKVTLALLMQKHVQKEKEDEELNCIVNEWTVVATCLDRLFFVIYLICIILSLIYLFPRPT